MKVREGAPTFSLGVAATCKSLEPRILDAPSAAPRLLHTHTHTHTQHIELNKRITRARPISAALLCLFCA